MPHSRGKGKWHFKSFLLLKIELEKFKKKFLLNCEGLSFQNVLLHNNNVFYVQELMSRFFILHL